MPKAHVWVQHTIEKILVVQNFDNELHVVRQMDPERRVAYGCDDCGQPLDDATFAEPCLSELDDEMDAQLDESAEEEGD